MRKALLLTLCLIAATAASAAESEGEEGASKAATPGNNVDMPSLMAPVIVDGKLTGYFYITSRVRASSSSSAIAIREKIAFIQDAFVRDVNAHPVMDKDPANLDRTELGNRLVADARKIVGADKITGITFGDGDKDIGVTFSSLRLDATPSAAPVEEFSPIAESEPAPRETH